MNWQGSNRRWQGVRQPTQANVGQAVRPGAVPPGFGAGSRRAGAATAYPSPGEASSIAPPSQGQQYGRNIGYGGMRTMVFWDADQDGVDDRDQAGPGRPTQRPVAPTKPGPTPFRSVMADPYGNATTPDQFYNQQQAMIARLYGQLGQMPSGTYLGPGAPPPAWSQAPQFDVQGMWSAAGQDVQNGWRNPLAGLFGK